METALHVAEGFDAPVDLTTNHERLYFGNHTCEELLPTAAETAAARRAATAAGRPFSLVGPCLCDARLDAFIELLDVLQPADEVIVNDWGLLHHLATARPDLEPVAGVLLTRAPRDPRAAFLEDAAKGYEPSAKFLALLKDRGVSRLELCQPTSPDAPLRLPEGVRLSVYTSLSVLAVTRRCPWRAALTSPAGEAGRCPRPCRGRAVRLRSRDNATEYLLRWNAWLTEPAGEWAPRGAADRLVFMQNPGGGTSP